MTAAAGRCASFAVVGDEGREPSGGEEACRASLPGLFILAPASSQPGAAVAPPSSLGWWGGLADTTDGAVAGTLPPEESLVATVSAYSLEETALLGCELPLAANLSLAES